MLRRCVYDSSPKYSSRKVFKINRKIMRNVNENGNRFGRVAAPGMLSFLF